jgi:hypothetical protein
VKGFEEREERKERKEQVCVKGRYYARQMQLIVLPKVKVQSRLDVDDGVLFSLFCRAESLLGGNWVATLIL